MKFPKSYNITAKIPPNSLLEGFASHNTCNCLLFTHDSRKQGEGKQNHTAMMFLLVQIINGERGGSPTLRALFHFASNLQGSHCNGYLWEAMWITIHETFYLLSNFELTILHWGFKKADLFICKSIPNWGRGNSQAHYTGGGEVRGKFLTQTEQPPFVSFVFLPSNLPLKFVRIHKRQSGLWQIV